MRNRKNPKVMSFSELEHEIEIMEAIIPNAFSEFLDQFYRQSIVNHVWEDAVQLRVDDRVPKGEYQKGMDMLIEAQESMETDLLLEKFGSKDLKNKAEEIEQKCLGLLAKQKEAIDERIPEPKVKNPSKLTKRDLIRKSKRLHLVLDHFVDAYVGGMCIKHAHFDILMSVSQQYVDGDRSLADLKNWWFKWHRTRKSKEMQGQELCEYLEIPDLNKEKEILKKKLFSKIQLYLNQMYLDFSQQLQKPMAS